MKEDKLEAFKQVIRRRIDMRRMVAVCAGDEELARSLAVQGLRQIAVEIEGGRGQTPAAMGREAKYIASSRKYHGAEQKWCRIKGNLTS